MLRNSSGRQTNEILLHHLIVRSRPSCLSSSASLSLFRLLFVLTSRCTWDDTSDIQWSACSWKSIVLFFMFDNYLCSGIDHDGKRSIGSICFCCSVSQSSWEVLEWLIWRLNLCRNIPRLPLWRRYLHVAVVVLQSTQCAFQLVLCGSLRTGADECD